MQHNHRNLLITIGEWWEQRNLQKRTALDRTNKVLGHSAWLPTPGNVVFTILMLVMLLWAQNVGAISLGASLAATTSTAGIPYQGRLADKNGTPLTQTVNMIFRLYAAASGGSPLWEEQWTGANSVQVSDGLFNVMLGSLTPIPQAVITGNNNLFLGITVGTDSEMSPRVQLGSVPFATQALTVPDGSITKAKLASDVSLVPPNGSITTEKLADGAVTQVKAPSLVQALSGTGFKLQSGMVQKLTAGAVEEELDVNFPAAFLETPIVLITNCSESNQQNWNTALWMVRGQDITPTSFRARYRLAALSAGTYRGCWIAVGR